MKILVILGFLLAIFTSTSIAALNDSTRPFNDAQDKYYIMLMQSEFAKLDSEADSARKNLTTLADGQSQLAALYAGVSGCMTSGCQNLLSSDNWKDRLKKLNEWVKDRPNSITAKVALATYYLEYGWSIRGQHYVDSVPSEALHVFQDNVELSRVELMKLKVDGKSDPGWYTSLLRVGRSQGWSRQAFETLYNEAVSKFPRYIPLYFEMATYLAPRWYGSVPEFNAYVRKVTKTTYPILGDTLYARLNWLMATNDMFQNGQAEWSEMKKGFERIVKDYPHPWNIHNFANYSCFAGDMKTFKKLNTKIDGNPILDAFWGDKKNYESCLKASK
jgi:hypothetical protein